MRTAHPPVYGGPPRRCCWVDCMYSPGKVRCARQMGVDARILVSGTPAGEGGGGGDHLTTCLAARSVTALATCGRERREMLVIGGHCGHIKLHPVGIFRIQQLRTVETPRLSCRLCLACRCVLRTKSGSPAPCTHSDDDGGCRWTGNSPSAIRPLPGVWASSGPADQIVMFVITEGFTASNLSGLRWPLRREEAEAHPPGPGLDLKPRSAATLTSGSKHPGQFRTAIDQLPWAQSRCTNAQPELAPHLPGQWAYLMTHLP